MNLRQDTIVFSHMFDSQATKFTYQWYNRGHNLIKIKSIVLSNQNPHKIAGLLKTTKQQGKQKKTQTQMSKRKKYKMFICIYK